MSVSPKREDEVKEDLKLINERLTKIGEDCKKLETKMKEISILLKASSKDTNVNANVLMGLVTVGSLGLILIVGCWKGKIRF